MANRASGERVFAGAREEVREASLRALASLGWEPKTGPDQALTAVWTSSIFRFRDDLQVTLLADGPGTRVRVCSASRVGRYDFGQNARHVQRFFEELETELGGEAGRGRK